MSANLVVDLGQTCRQAVSVYAAATSGSTVGEPVDLLFENTYCNVFVAGGPSSGQAHFRVQTTDSLSGTWTDPTIGIPQSALPALIGSGGTLLVNSGLRASGTFGLPFGAPLSGSTRHASGGVTFAAFLRPHRYARLHLMSGSYTNFMTAGFVTNLKTTGSGGGQTFSPGSGLTVSGATVNGVFV